MPARTAVDAGPQRVDQGCKTILPGMPPTGELGQLSAAGLLDEEDLPSVLAAEVFGIGTTMFGPIAH